MKGAVVLPRRELNGLEPVRELLVRHQGLVRLLGSRANERDLEVVGEKADGVEDDALLPERPGQKGVDLVDDQHLHLQLAGERADTVPKRRDARTLGEDASHGAEKLLVEVALARRGRHLDRHRRHASPAVTVIEARSVITKELLDDPRLAHPGQAVDEKTGHAVAWRIVDELRQARQDTLGARVLNPPLPANPSDALVVR